MVSESGMLILAPKPGVSAWAACRYCNATQVCHTIKMPFQSPLIGILGLAYVPVRGAGTAVHVTHPP